MKNQYFGDINDYRKYGLIRALTGFGETKTTFCWMLTEDDGRSDGMKLQYLNQKKNRRFDPPLFDFLKDAVFVRKTRKVAVLEQSGIIQRARFSSLIVPQQSDERNRWFKMVLDSASGSDLVFFDPDNGMEVKSVAVGSKGSPKYLYWREAVHAYSMGHSLLIYQHFPGEEREFFIRRLAVEFVEKMPCDRVIIVKTGNVAFFLLSQLPFLPVFEKRLLALNTLWDAQFELRNFDRDHL